METYPTPEQRRRRFTRYFIRRLADYAIVCGFLILVNWQTTPHRWWVFWVAAGWGLHIALLGIRRLTDCDEEYDYRH